MDARKDDLTMLEENISANDALPGQCALIGLSMRIEWGCQCALTEQSIRTEKISWMGIMET